MKYLQGNLILKNIVGLVIWLTLFIVNVRGMEDTDRGAGLGGAGVNIVHHYHDDISYDTYHNAIKDRINILTIKATDGLDGANQNTKNAISAAATVAKDLSSTTVQINLPLLDSQTLYVRHGAHNATIGHVTINARAATFSLGDPHDPGGAVALANPGVLNPTAHPKDYYHIALEGIFYPSNDLIDDNMRIIGFTIGAEPTAVTEIPGGGGVVIPHSLDKLSIIQTAPLSTLRKATYASQVGLGFTAGLSVSANATIATVTPSLSFNFSTQHTKTLEIEDINIRNKSGMHGRNVEWNYEVANSAVDKHQTSPSSRSTIYAYSQVLWATDYDIVGVGLANIANNRSITFTPYIKVSWSTVSTSCCLPTPKYGHTQSALMDGDPITVNLRQDTIAPKAFELLQPATVGALVPVVPTHSLVMVHCSVEPK